MFWFALDVRPLTQFRSTGSHRLFNGSARSAAERRASTSEHGRLLLLVSAPSLLASHSGRVLTHLHRDSIIRGNDYIFRSEEQQHSFNYPVQIGTNSKDLPLRDAQRFNIKVQKDDVSPSWPATRR